MSAYCRCNAIISSINLAYIISNKYSWKLKKIIEMLPLNSHNRSWPWASSMRTHTHTHIYIHSYHFRNYARFEYCIEYRHFVKCFRPFSADAFAEISLDSIKSPPNKLVQAISDKIEDNHVRWLTLPTQPTIKHTFTKCWSEQEKRIINKSHNKMIKIKL